MEEIISKVLCYEKKHSLSALTIPLSFSTITRFEFAHSKLDNGLDDIKFS